MNISLSMTRTIRNLTAAMALCLITSAPAFPLNKRVNFEFTQQPMAEVANQISRQLNYKVLMDDDIASVLVSGYFSDVTLDEFFSRRIFRGKNIVIMFNDDKQVVTIRSLGNKKNMTQYDQTVSTRKGIVKTDSMDQEVQPGVKRRDMTVRVNDLDPQDREIQPGVLRRDMKVTVNATDPMDREVLPGVKRSNIPAPTIADPNTVEVQPGIKSIDVIRVSSWNDVNPLDREVQPGIKRRDVPQLNSE